jgi:hypothetical protein
MSNPNAPQTYRLKMTPAESDGSQFTMNHGRPLDDRPSSRRLQKMVELLPTRQEIGERALIMTAEHWDQVKALASRHGGSFGTDDLTPMAGLTFGRALREALAGSMEPAFRDEVNAVIRLCMFGRGLRVNTKRV